ncbi:phytosulfokines 5-like [Diospyros lotus]|uniref:phytosulfokines 5-like n=1 Tax=Diospyros lotus TaxID=55363 RepID=UPI00224D22CA|nr:phytosulfokines 5-like [Diospyros lotus]
MSKFVTTLFLLALLLSPMLSHAAARPMAMAKAQLKGTEVDAGEDSCEEVEKEECLMRRTLAAHLDYIYTQKQHHP